MTQPDQNYRDELQKRTHAPAQFVDLYYSVEEQISSVVDGAAPLNVAGDVISELFRFIDDAGTDVSDLCVSQAKEIVELRTREQRLATDLAAHVLRSKSMQQTIENLEELARTQQQQIAAHARSTAGYQTSVIERDEIIADKSKLLRSQNEIIAGLHELRRKQVGELNVAVIACFEALKISSVDVSDELLNRIAARTAGAQYALTVTRHPSTLSTRFEITRTKGELA
jgi:vacuolar-type H+-ATPase subunit I/STV1